MNVSHYVGIVAIVGIGLAVAPAVNAQSTHGAFAVRLGVGVPLDNNMRDWKNADVISGFTYFMNHSAGTSMMTGVDVDTQLHTKHGNSARAMGITYTVRKLMGDDSGARNYVGLGLGIYRTEHEELLIPIGSTSTTTGITKFCGKAMIGRMDNRGRFTEMAYTYTGSSLSNGLSATVGLRF